MSIDNIGMDYETPSPTSYVLRLLTVTPGAGVAIAAPERILGDTAEWESGLYFANTVPLCSSTVNFAANPTLLRRLLCSCPARRLIRIVSGSIPS
jgi:hypothetical protein